MKKLTLILASMTLLASCGQIAANKDEVFTLETTANDLGDIYVACVVDNSLNHMSADAIDVATSIQLAGGACATDLSRFEESQNEYLSSQYMMTEKPLQASIDALNERATTEVGEALLSAAKMPNATAIPAAAATAAIATSGGTAERSSEQQAYLDCMEDQGHKYAGLDESATVIADVAQGRCKSYMADPGAAALEQEGRAMVMGIVLDAKLAGPDQQPNQ
jgi:hypothetical protein